MSEAPQKQGLFSALSMGRAARQGTATMAGRSPASSAGGDGLLSHPLLGTSTPASGSSTPATATFSSDTASTSGTAASKASGQAVLGTGPIDTLSLPYKPRQRHSHQASYGSIASVSGPFAAGAAVPGASGSSTATSPVTAATIVAGPPTTSTSTTTPMSATFALPVSAMESSVSAGSTASSDTSPATLGSASATSRLQLQSLKAAAQKIGLGNGTMGMAVVDAIFDKGQVGRSDTGEWADIFRVLTDGKVVLFLPTTPSSSLPITPQTLRDHIAFLSPPTPLYDGASGFTASQKGKEAPTGSYQSFVTISGLVGTVSDNSLRVESILPSDSPILQALRNPSTRTEALSSLRPTHDIHTSDAVSLGLPVFELSPETASLPFPPLGKSGQAGVTDGKTGKDRAVSASSKLGRINPFMSLFGGGAASTSQANTPAAPSSPSRPAIALNADQTLTVASPSSPQPPSINIGDGSDAASIRSDGTSPQAEGYHVSAYTVSKPLRISDVQKSLAKAVRGEIKTLLAGVPEKTVDRVVKLATSSIASPSGASASNESSKNDDPNVKLDFSLPGSTGQKLQDLVETVYDDMVAYYRSSDSALLDASQAASGLNRRTSGSGMPWSGRASVSVADESEQERTARRDAVKRQKEDAIEKESTDVAERVEALVCRLLYNRLFSPIDSDDARHDEALASRIAALNMLDLSLDHLGLITRPSDEGETGRPGGIADGLASIVARIGDELQKLTLASCLSPRDKADVLITAHKLVVDGLAALPPIQLRPEGERYTPDAADMTPRVERTDSESLLPGPVEGLRIHVPGDDNGTADPALSPATAAQKTPVPTQQSAPVADMPNLELIAAASSLESEQDAQPGRDGDAHLADSAATVHPPAGAADDVKRAKDARPGTSGADLILPIIIFAVVKANPPQLASQLMYLRRYRSAICLTGEASYALVNLTAVVEFLEHVDLAELGLGGESDRVMSIADLSPIGLDYLEDSNADTQSIASASSRLRGRVFQVSELAGTAAGTANKALTSVLDSSWSAVSAVRGLINNATPTSSPQAAAAAGNEEGTVPGPAVPADDATGSRSTRPGLRARQASTFSLASVTASVASMAAARTRSRASSRASELQHQPAVPQQVWAGNQEMIDVSSSSRPESIRERDEDGTGYPSDAESITGDGGEVSPGIAGRGQEEDSAISMMVGGERGGRNRQKSDTRSIMSVSSMMSRDRSDRDPRDSATIIPSLASAAVPGKEERASLSDRLANIGVMGRLPSTEGASVSSGRLRTPPHDSPTSGSIPLAGGGGPLHSTRSHPDAVASGLSSAAQSHSRRSSLLGVGALDGHLSHRLRSNSASPSLGTPTDGSPAKSLAARPNGPVTTASPPARDGIEPPIERFMTCELADIRLSEIGTLLRDYRRLANIVQAMNAQAGS